MHTQYRRVQKEISSLLCQCFFPSSEQDENDNPPILFSNSSFSFTLSENSPSATSVGSFEATDMDLGPAADIFFALEGEYSSRYNNIIQ